MPSFSYIARTSEGTLEKGTIAASNTEAAREKLRKKQLMVEELQEENSPSARPGARSDGPMPIGFAGSMPWTTTEDDLSTVPPPAQTIRTTAEDMEYLPLVDTLRLFAGWLLAWYGIVYLLGWYQISGKISSDIPFLQALFASSLVLRFAFGTFLFLLLTSVHAWAGKGAGKAIGLGVLGIVIFFVFHLYA